MRITLNVETYKGVDGSSLSATRCSQIVQVYEMLEKLGRKNMTYIDIQQDADNAKLFGETNAKSAIRTFFPLLKKLEFVNYDGQFAANDCFTDLGKQFVFACRALENVTDGTPHKEEIIARLNNIKQNSQKEGLVRMRQNPEYKDHNIWVALKLLKELKTINWYEFLYALYALDNGRSIEDAIDSIRAKKSEIDSIIFVNEENKVLPTTCYIYIRSFLEEAGLISKISSHESKLLESADKLLSQINL